MILTEKILKQYSNKNPPTSALGRNEIIQKKYDEFKNNQNLTENFLKKIKIQIKENNYYLHENDFPYNVDNNIKHLLLWYVDDNIINDILLNLKNKLITYWINNNDNKSIQEINHIHIFVKV